MSKRGWILVVLLIALGGGGFWFWKTQVVGTPTYSLKQAAQAVEDHDLQRFRKYVDVEGVSERLVDDVVAQAQSGQTASGEWEQLGQSLGRGLVELMKPRLVEEIESSVERFVETGEMPAEYGQRAEIPSGAVDSLFRGIRKAETEGSTAMVTVGINDVRADTAAVLELRMRKMDGYWQVAEIANVGDLLSEGTGSGTQYVSTKKRAYKASMKADLRNLAVAQEVYYADEFSYASSLTDLQAVTHLELSQGVTVTIQNTANEDDEGWSATADHGGVAGSGDCGIYFGSVRFPTRSISGTVEPTEPGAPVCQEGT